mmetsp:Transcript_110926/g.237006  ORF Transcript_110926/g.237006 Transcript_110926/m.237006 type:complete len:346 (+) Transcript_110926:52-1089(+)
MHRGSLESRRREKKMPPSLQNLKWVIIFALQLLVLGFVILPFHGRLCPVLVPSLRMVEQDILAGAAAVVGLAGEETPRTASAAPPATPQARDLQTFDHGCSGALASWVAVQAPPAARRCSRRPSGKPLIILAGHGMTGNDVVASRLAELGLNTAHWDKVMRCEAFDHTAGKCSKVMRDADLSSRWIEVRDKLGNLGRTQYSSIDFCKELAGLDVVSDVPMPQFWPYIYMAYREAGAKVIMTVTNATKWPRLRQGGDRKRRSPKAWSDLAPLGWLFSRSIWHGYTPASDFSMAGMTGKETSSATWAFLAEAALAMCLVPPRDILVLDVSKQSQATLQQLLSKFLQR